MTKPTLRRLVAGNIRRFAREKNVPINSLADFAGVSRTQLYDFLAGRKGISLDWLEKIALALEVEPWRLLAPPGVGD